MRSKYYRVDYQVRVVIGSADVRFELWFDGQKMNKDSPIRVEWQETTAPDLEDPVEEGKFIQGKVPRRSVPGMGQPPGVPVQGMPVKAGEWNGL